MGQNELRYLKYSGMQDEPPADEINRWDKKQISGNGGPGWGSVSSGDELHRGTGELLAVWDRPPVFTGDGFSDVYIRQNSSNYILCV